MEVTQRAARESMVSSGFLDVKEQVRQAVDIVDLVGHYIQLRRQGRGYVGLCPWHDDSRPSLQVNPERQSFKCWVCDIGGDVFSFTMKMEGVTFREALEILAERAGVKLQDRSAPAPGSPQSADDKRTLYKAMAWAESQYHRCLLESPDAEPARRYLAERGITTQNIEKFNLGFSPNQWDWIVGRTSSSGRSGASPNRVKILEAIGILARRGDGGIYDRFKGRVLFSIRDSQGRPVGIGGRILPELAESHPAKYVNSPETKLFSKSRLLYGLDVAREPMRKKGVALVMEGYTDCIMAHQHGFENAVAVLGTALGEEHVRILKRFVDRVVLVLDGDEAGRRRANEVLELFIAQNLDLHVLTLPGGADPCEYLQAAGSEAFARLLESETVDALEHARRAAVAGIDLANDVHGATRALERVLAILAKAPQGDATASFREEKILARLAREFAVSEEEIRRRLTQLRRSARRPLVKPRQVPPPRPAHPGEAEFYGYNGEDAPPQPETAAFRAADLRRASPAEYELVELLVKRPDLLPAARDAVAPERMTQAPCRRLYETFCRLSDAGREPTFARLMLEFDEPAMKALLVDLDESERTAGASDAESLLLDIKRSFERLENFRQDPAQVAALKNQGLDESQKQDLLLDMLGKLRTRHGISSPTDG